MSNKADEALYNTLESPQRRCPAATAAQKSVPAIDTNGTINDYDYTDMMESSYQKLNPTTNIVTKNVYSSLVANSNNEKEQIPQDYLTPVVISEKFKEYCKTTSPVIVKENNTKQRRQPSCTYFWLLLLLTCISLLIATIAMIISVVALLSANNNHSSVSELPSKEVVITEEIRESNDNNSTIKLNNKLSEFYSNITAQLEALMDSLNDVASTATAQNNELKLIKGVHIFN